MKRLGIYALTIFTLVGVWQLRAMQIDNAALFPYPINVADALWSLLGSIETYRIIAHSLFRLVVSVGASSLVGIALGIVAGFVPVVSLVLRPIVSGLRSLPVASLIVIILILYGQQRAVYIIGFLMVFPVMFESAHQGVLNTNPAIVRAMRIEAVPKWKKLVYVHLPLSVPYIKTGFIQSIGLGFKVLVMAEFIAQTQTSIGRMLYLGRINVRYADVFAWSAIIILLVLGFEMLIHRLRRSGG